MHSLTDPIQSILKINIQSARNIEERIAINGVRLSNIRYADDTIMFADITEGLQTLVTV